MALRKGEESCDFFLISLRWLDSEPFISFLLCHLPPIALDDLPLRVSKFNGQFGVFVSEMHNAVAGVAMAISIISPRVPDVLVELHHPLVVGC